MKLFKMNQGNKLTQLSETKFDKEKTLQAITEKNLDLIFGLEFVCSEFTVDDYRLDTLAFDLETKSFVIIEYKRIENRSVIDQGFAYLGKMLERKADFVLQYNNLKNKSHSTKDIDWEQSRILFVSTAFNKYQLGSLVFSDLPIYLWEAKLYKDGHISYRKIENSSSGVSIKKFASTNANITKVVKQVAVYTEEDHLQKANEDIKELYQVLRCEIMERWGLTIESKKNYIAFKKNTNVVDVVIQKASLKLVLNVSKGKLKDERGIARDVSEKGKRGNGDYQVIMKDGSRFIYIMSLIEQSVNAQ